MSSKQITVKRVDVKGFSLFLREIQEAAIEGYMVDVDALGVRNGPSMNGKYSCWVHKEEDLILEGDVDNDSEGDLDNDSEGDVDEGEAVTESQDTKAEVKEESTEDGVTDEVPYNILDDNKAKKVDLIAYAESIEVIIPEGVSAPAAIRKYLREKTA